MDWDKAQETAQDLLDEHEDLSAWEMDFLESLVEQAEFRGLYGTGPSAAQVFKLNEIVGKYL